VTTFEQGTFPDGITFDSEGFAWIASIVSNRVIRVAFSGEQEIIMEDSDKTHLTEVEAAFQANIMDRPHIDKIKSQRLKNISSLAFGGPELKTAYLGSLLGESVESFPSFVAGHPPAHWKY
jgi:sugar lactone lactonase YvrE